MVQEKLRKAVINEIKAVAFADFTKFVTVKTDENGSPVIEVAAVDNLPRRCKKAVCQIKAGTRGIEIKLFDKLRALEMLGRSCGAFTCEDGDRSTVEALRSLFEESEEFETD